jgi:hypothetical protein
LNSSISENQYLFNSMINLSARTRPGERPNLGLTCPLLAVEGTCERPAFLADQSAGKSPFFLQSAIGNSFLLYNLSGSSGLSGLDPYVAKQPFLGFKSCMFG